MTVVYLSDDANPQLCRYLKEKDCELRFTEPLEIIDPPIAKHADIYMCKLGSEDSDPVYIGGKAELGAKYPEDVRFNAVVSGKRIICNEKYISGNLLAAAREFINKKYGCDAEIVHVSQGYCKCNLAVVSENAFITEDEGMHRALSKLEGVKCLLLKTHSVQLPGYKYGFIGGCCGLLEGELIFNGDLSLHPEYTRIREFCESEGVCLKWFGGKLTDIGSILICKNV